MLWLLVALVGPGYADSPCGADCAAVADLSMALDAPARPRSEALPRGTLSSADVEAAFLRVQRSGGGLSDLFGLLADGVPRTLPGAAVRDMMDKFGVTLDILPLDKLGSVVSDGGSVEFRFDFSGTHEIELPGTATWTLANNGDLQATRGNRPRKKRGDSSELRFKSTVRFTVDENGLTGLRKGDIEAYGGFLAGWVNLNLFSESHEGRVAKDGKRVLLETDESGDPLVRDGRYVPQRYDNWLVITGPLGYRQEIGIPSW